MAVPLRTNSCNSGMAARWGTLASVSLAPERYLDHLFQRGFPAGVHVLGDQAVRRKGLPEPELERVEVCPGWTVQEILEREG
jgi:hypothetical protein